MAKISINGKNLHEIRMRLKGRRGSISYLSYPEHRIKAEVRNKTIVLHIPPVLVIALFDSVLKNKKIFSMKLDNKKIGLFRLIDITYPDQLYDDGLVDIKMEAVNEQRNSEESSWSERP